MIHVLVVAIVTSVTVHVVAVIVSPTGDFMPASRTLFFVALAHAGCLLATPATAQIRASERGIVSQTVDGTVITVDYGRAQARGRDSLFGKVVTKDEVWTPGANAATTLQVSRDVTVGDKPLPAGKYSVWLVSNPAAPWTLYFHRNAGLFHTQHPKSADMAFAVTVPHTTATEHVEMLTFDFPRVSPTRAELRLRWGTTVVPVEIGVTPSMRPVVMTPEQMAPYLGSYGVTFEAPDGKRSPEVKLAIVNAKGSLRGIMDMPGDGMELEYLPTSTPHRFMPAFLKNGAVFDVEIAPVDFQVVDGRAVGFVAMFDGKKWMEGTRKR